MVIDETEDCEACLDRVGLSEAVESLLVRSIAFWHILSAQIDVRLEVRTLFALLKSPKTLRGPATAAAEGTLFPGMAVTVEALRVAAGRVVGLEEAMVVEDRVFSDAETALRVRVVCHSNVRLQLIESTSDIDRPWLLELPCLLSKKVNKAVEVSCFA